MNLADGLKQLMRMCKTIRLCTICPLKGSDLCSMPQEDRSTDANEMAAAIIEKRAEENSEPNYPTWIELLQSFGVIPYLSGYVAKRDDDGNYLDGHVNVNEVAHKPIPVDIAQKLGIEPKEI